MTIPEDEVEDIDMDSEFEVLKKSASRTQTETPANEKEGLKDAAKELAKTENEKDSSSEKSKSKTR